MAEMTDPLSWSLNLGRWAGTQVRIHVLMLAFVLLKLAEAASTKGGSLTETSAWLALLLVAVIMHEVGHMVVASRLGLEVEEIRLWPLGSLAPPSPPSSTRYPETVLVALAGPLFNGVWALISAMGLYIAQARLDFNPFATGGAPSFIGTGVSASPLSGVWFIGWFGYLNWMLCLLNLIPALPLDGGRVFRAVWAGSSRDVMVPTWTARASAAILLVVGLLRLFTKHSEQGAVLLLLAFLIEWVVRTESRMIEDGGFFDDGVFGYDFSQGYTSLEGGVPKVRPYRESALKRWRRRRSELRRQRRIEQEAAEESRMDEILEKLHRDGRAGLTDEEYRFLVRVSHKFRSRSKARG
jgi:stage IV sporulation protein FB